MISRLSLTLTSVFLALGTISPALAGVVPVPRSTDIDQCNHDNVQCCNSVQAPDSAPASELLAFVGAVVQDPNTLVGLTCNPISAVGIGGNSCTGQTVCCDNNNFGGVVAVGCTPINLPL